MQLIVISGRSGSGKSTALQALEDVGFYCIDNLPAALLPVLVEQLIAEQPDQSRLAVCIDIRNPKSQLISLPKIIQDLQSQSIDVEVVFLDASNSTLIKRFSATRRRHPMASESLGLEESIQREEERLKTIADLAAIRIDTSRMNLYDLRDAIKGRIAKRSAQALSLQFQSFGFKHGVPLDADIVYDMRILPNPYWVPELRLHTGLEQPIIEFLQRQQEVQEMLVDIKAYLDKWLGHFARNNRSYVTVAIGCTGGHHRSVYIAEQLGDYFGDKYANVQVRHRELSKQLLAKP